MKERGRYLYLPFSLTTSYCYLPSFLVLKDILQRDSKSSCNLEGEGDGWHVFPLLKRDNGLPGTADTVGQFLLRHFIVVKTQPPDSVCYLYIRHFSLLSSNQSGYRGTELSY